MSIFISALIFILAFSVAAFIRFHYLPDDCRPVFEINANLLHGNHIKNSRLDKSLTVILSAVIIITAGIFIYSIASPVAGEQYPEFYILPDADGQYPKEAVIKRPFEVTLIVINRENKKEKYRLEVKFDNRIISSKTSEELDYAGQWKIPLALELDKTGSNQKVEFYLYKGNSSLPYRDKPLWLNIDVNP